MNFQESSPKKRGRKPKTAVDTSSKTPTKITKQSGLNLYAFSSTSSTDETSDNNLKDPEDILLVSSNCDDIIEKNSTIEEVKGKNVKGKMTESSERLDPKKTYLTQLYVDPIPILCTTTTSYDEYCNSKPFFEDPSGYFQILQDFTKGYPTKTDVLCWWCCHSFDSHPIGIPVSYDDRTDIFKVVGCFCTFSCACAHLQEKNGKIDRFHVNERELLSMYKILTRQPTTDIKLTAAPDRLCLKAFGGKLTIEEFRACATLGMEFSMSFAPMMPWNMYIEEISNIHKKFGKKPLQIRKAKTVTTYATRDFNDSIESPSTLSTSTTPTPFTGTTTFSATSSSSLSAMGKKVARDSRMRVDQFLSIS